MDKLDYNNDSVRFGEPKVLVIGLDGATFDLIKPWVDEGRLPNIGNLMKRGVWGNLKSVIPTLSAPAWVSFMTGKNLGKHGIFDFMVYSGDLHFSDEGDLFWSWRE